MFNKIKTLFKSSSVYTIGNVLKRALFLISMPIITRVLAPSEYGILALINSITGILLTVYGLAVGDYAMRYYFEAESRYEQKKMIGTLFIFILLNSFVLTALLLTFGGKAFNGFFNNIPFSPYMLIGIWVCFISVLDVLPDALLRINDSALLFVSINFSRSLIVILLSILSIVVLKMGAEGPLYSSLAVAIMFGFFYFYYLKDKMVLAFSVETVKQCLKFSLPVLLMLLGRILLDSTDRIFLQKLVNTTTVGLYSIGATMGSVLVMIASSINAAWMPFFYRHANTQDDPAGEMFAYVGTYLVLLISFICLIPILFRYEIIYVLAPEEYYSVIDIIPIIMVGALFNALFYIPVIGIYQGKKTPYLILIILSGLIVNVVGNIIYIPTYGMAGAAMSTLIAAMLMLVICYFVSQNIYYIPFQIKRLIKPAIIFAACVSLSYYVNTDWHVAVQFLCRVSILGLFPISLFLLRFFNTNELSRIKGMLLR